MVMERPVVELGEFPDATLDAGADCGGPEHAVPTELQVAIAALCQEPLDFFIGSACKEKDFVKVSLPGKFGLLLWQAGVLTSSRGESERKVTTGTPVSRESVC